VAVFHWGDGDVIVYELRRTGCSTFKAGWLKTPAFAVTDGEPDANKGARRFGEGRPETGRLRTEHGAGPFYLVVAVRNHTSPRLERPGCSDVHLQVGSLRDVRCFNGLTRTGSMRTGTCRRRPS